MPERTLTHGEAKAFYDRFARVQDLQRFYEDAVVERLLARAALADARSVVDFGCGTGRVAERLLRSQLSADATYLGLDVSSTMVAWTRARVKPWSERARVALVEGRPQIPLDDGTCDRVISTFVVDLLSAEDIRALFGETRRVLAPSGLLCVASLTRGDTGSARLLTRAWMGLHRLSPALVGGCRPVDAATYLDASWRIVHREVVRPFGLCSEVLIASPASPAGAAHGGA